MREASSETQPLLDPDSIAEEAAVQIFESAITDVDQEDDSDDIRWLREQRLAHKSLAWHRKPTVTIMCAVLFLYFVSAMVYVASYVMLLLTRVCIHEQSLDASVVCSDSRVQQSMTSIQAKILLANGVVGVIAGGKIGGMSDRVGRKPLLIFACGMALINKIGDLLLILESTPFHPWFFILNGGIMGLGGGISMMVSLASSYVTDIVEPHARTTMLGFTIGAFYAGLGVGPLIGSFIVHGTGEPLYTLYVSIGLNICLVVLGIFVIPESRPQKSLHRSQSMHLQRRASFASQRSIRPPSWKNYIHDGYDSVAESLSIVQNLWLPKHRAIGFIPRYNFVLLVAVECLVIASAVAIGGPIVMYAVYNFHANSEALGYYIAATGLSKTFVLYFVSPLLLHLLKKISTVHWSAPDRIDMIMISIAVFFELCVPLLVLVAKNEMAVFATAILGSLGAFCTPTVQSTIIKYVPENKTGTIFGALAVLKNIIGMLAPSGALYVYSQTVNFMPKAVFYVFVALLFIAAVLIQFVRLHGEIDINEFHKKRSSSIESLPSSSSVSTMNSTQETHNQTHSETNPQPAKNSANVTTIESVIAGRRASVSLQRDHQKQTKG